MCENDYNFVTVPRRKESIWTKHRGCGEGCAVVFLLGFILIAGGYCYHISTSPAPALPGDPEIETRQHIISYARDAVKRKLKSPSSAKFPNLYDDSYTVEDLGKGDWKVTGYVDSQNSFGAMIRSAWTILYTMGIEKIYPYYLKIGDRIIYDYRRPKSQGFITPPITQAFFNIPYPPLSPDNKSPNPPSINTNPHLITNNHPPANPP